MVVQATVFALDPIDNVQDVIYTDTHTDRGHRQSVDVHADAFEADVEEADDTCGDQRDHNHAAGDKRHVAEGHQHEDHRNDQDSADAIGVRDLIVEGCGGADSTAGQHELDVFQRMRGHEYLSPHDRFIDRRALGVLIENYELS